MSRSIEWEPLVPARAPAICRCSHCGLSEFRTRHEYGRDPGFLCVHLPRDRAAVHLPGFGYAMERPADMTDARLLARHQEFLDYEATDDGFLDLFVQLRAKRIIP
jgi:hypothetical protein